MENNDLRLAVLIDADNVPYAHVQAMMEEITRYGTPTIKRIYGDWTSMGLSGWKKVLLENAISPIQQYGYTVGKNSTDSAMIIDAMDILYSNKVDGFCIVSSDSDFTRLAMRLREAGMRVIGIGEHKTPTPFIVACDRFIYLEILSDQKEEQKPEPKTARRRRPRGKASAAEADSSVQEPAESAAASEPEAPSAEEARPKISKVDASVLKLLTTSVDDIADENGWAYLGDVGNLIQKKKPSFDSRNYGYRKLSSLIKSTGKFEMESRETANAHVKHIFIRVIGVTDVR
ncbi:MAG: NYN domain-containing protein [Clostridiales bacterium]|nr:NYN domain-containing protein [Clostridiales bacterium]